MKQEEIKEYFKNVKEVRCLSDGVTYDISKKGTYSFKYGWLSYDLYENQYGEDCVFMYNSKNNQLAEIISYR